MITSRNDYFNYLEADRHALHRMERRPRLFGDEIWKFQRTMRALEFYTNCQTSFLGRVYRLYLEYRFHALSIKCGFSIPPNVFGPGLAIVHRGTIIVHSRSVIGANCRLHACVNIGASGGDRWAVPTIGDNVYIGPGAKISE